MAPCRYWGAPIATVTRTFAALEFLTAEPGSRERSERGRARGEIGGRGQRANFCCRWSGSGDEVSSRRLPRRNRSISQLHGVKGQGTSEIREPQGPEGDCTGSGRPGASSHLSDIVPGRHTGFPSSRKVAENPEGIPSTSLVGVDPVLSCQVRGAVRAPGPCTQEALCPTRPSAAPRRVPALHLGARILHSPLGCTGCRSYKQDWHAHEARFQLPSVDFISRPRVFIWLQGVLGAARSSLHRLLFQRMDPLVVVCGLQREQAQCCSPGLSCPMACGVLAPQPGTDPPCVRCTARWILNHRTTCEDPRPH